MRVTGAKAGSRLPCNRRLATPSSKDKTRGKGIDSRVGSGRLLRQEGIYGATDDGEASLRGWG